MAAQVTGVSNPPLKSLNKIFTIIVTYLQKPEKDSDQKEEREKKREREKRERERDINDFPDTARPGLVPNSLQIIRV